MLDKELLKLLGPKKKYVILVVVLSVIGLLSSTTITISICYAIALLLRHINGWLETPLLFLYPLFASLLALVVRFLCSYFSGVTKEKLSSGVKKELRQKAYDKILTLGTKSADGLNMAGLTQVALEGVEQLDLYYSVYLPQFFYSMLAPFILFFITLPFSWQYAVVLLCCVPLIPVSIVAVSKYAKKVFAKYWGVYTSMGDTFLDSIQGLKELKLFKADQRKNDEINASAEEFRKITMKVLVMQLASVTIMDLVAYAGAGAGTAVVIVSLVNGSITGPRALFLILVAVEFFLPLRALGSAFHVAMNGASAGKKLLGLLQAEEPVWGEEKANGTEIKLENVSFSYDGTRDVLRNIEMTFPEKGVTAIVGESGSGKSTIANLIIGAYKPKEGSLLCGGKPLSSLSRESYFSHIGIVSYNTYIFSCSVRDNFKMAKQDVTDEEIYAALDKVNLRRFIENSGGLDKNIEEDASNISGGERQRLALAINLVANKDIYVFDEATSNIDVDSEAIIMDNVFELAKDKSIILISHRLANVVKAERIYFLENGEIKEEGTHEALLAKNGEYASLYKTQKTLEEGYHEFLAFQAKEAA